MSSKINVIPPEVKAYEEGILKALDEIQEILIKHNLTYFQTLEIGQFLFELSAEEIELRIKQGVENE
jgi:hypothetical protein